MIDFTRLTDGASRLRRWATSLAPAAYLAAGVLGVLLLASMMVSRLP